MIYAVISIAIASIGQAILKNSLNQLNLENIGFSLKFIATVLSNWQILFGLGCYGISAFFWIYALSKCSLSRVYPLTSLSFVFVIVLARTILGESINLNQSIGLMFIILGIFVGSVLK